MHLDFHDLTTTPASKTFHFTHPERRLPLSSAVFITFTPGIVTVNLSTGCLPSVNAMGLLFPIIVRRASTVRRIWLIECVIGTITAGVQAYFTSLTIGSFVSSRHRQLEIFVSFSRHKWTTTCQTRQESLSTIPRRQSHRCSSMGFSTWFDCSPGTLIPEHRTSHLPTIPLPLAGIYSAIGNIYDGLSR